MDDRILFIGLDVDDNAYHAGVLSKDDKFDEEFRCKPTISSLVDRLKRFSNKGYELRVCYEATYLGFSLCRQLRKRGFSCEVIAPSLVPRKPGKKVKTDRLDGRKLARYYKSGDLTTIHVPTEEEETVRDLVRSRGHIAEKARKTKLQIISLCRRQGWQYREPGKKDNYWTPRHRQWLRENCNSAQYPALRINLSQMLAHLEQEEYRLQLYDLEIDRIAHLPQYWTKVQALICYRGINILTAMIVILELGDIHRFNHPKRVTAFVGMDLIEDSSGGKEKKYRITKMGNSYVRKAAVEACQSVFKRPNVGRALKMRRDNIDERFILIADRCHKRLHKKATRLLYGGKLRNKIKVAAARELLGFVWESLREAA